MLPTHSHVLYSYVPCVLRAICWTCTFVAAYTVRETPHGLWVLSWAHHHAPRDVDHLRPASRHLSCRYRDRYHPICSAQPPNSVTPAAGSVSRQPRQTTILIVDFECNSCSCIGVTLSLELAWGGGSRSPRSSSRAEARSLPPWMNRAILSSFFLCFFFFFSFARRLYLDHRRLVGASADT